MEKKTQSKIIAYLKKKGCYVIKTQAAPGTPVGTPDIIFFKEGFYGVIECKASKTAKWRPLQKETLQKLDEWSWGRAVYPENYNEVVAELDTIL